MIDRLRMGVASFHAGAPECNVLGVFAEPGRLGVVTPRCRRARRAALAALLLALTAAVLAGCGGASQRDLAFRAHVTRVCSNVSMASPVTKLGYAKQQRQASMEIATLARLHPPTSGERQTYRDLLMHLNRIHAFFEREESGAIALNRYLAAHPRTFRAAVRRAQRFLRPIAADTSSVLNDISSLHLDHCPALSGL